MGVLRIDGGNTAASCRDTRDAKHARTIRGAHGSDMPGYCRAEPHHTYTSEVDEEAGESLSDNGEAQE